MRKAAARWFWPAAAGAALLSAGGLAALYLRPSAPAGESVRLQIPLPQNTTFTVSGNFAISPDGKKLVFAAIDADNVARFWVRALDSLERLFQLPRNFMALSPYPGQFIDVTRDNQRFLAELPVIKTPLDEFTVVLNWPAGVQR